MIQQVTRASQPLLNTFMIDMPRSLPKKNLAEFHPGLECSKNGKVADKRYKYKSVGFYRPQVMLFSNKFPDFALMSTDCWRIYKVEPDMDMVLIPTAVAMGMVDRPPKRARARSSSAAVAHEAPEEVFGEGAEEAAEDVD